MADKRTRLIQLRVNKNMSAQDVAEALNISTAMVLYMEQGKKTCSAKTLRKMAKLFDVTMDELYNVMGI